MGNTVKSKFHGTTHDEAARYYAANGPRQIANNTYIQLGHHEILGSAYHLYLYSTPVITWHASGAITFNTGGYQSKTTKDRMSQFSPHGVFQRAGQWYVQPFHNWEVAAIPFGDDGTVTIGKNGSQLDVITEVSLHP